MTTPSCADNRVVCIYQFLQEIAQESASFRKKARENQSIIKGYSQSKLVHEGQIRELTSENAELKYNLAIEPETNAAKVGSLQSENTSLIETVEHLTKITTNYKPELMHLSPRSWPFVHLLALRNLLVMSPLPLHQVTSIITLILPRTIATAFHLKILMTSMKMIMAHVTDECTL